MCMYTCTYNDNIFVIFGALRTPLPNTSREHLLAENWASRGKEPNDVHTCFVAFLA